MTLKCFDLRLLNSSIKGTSELLHTRWDPWIYWRHGKIEKSVSITVDLLSIGLKSYFCVTNWNSMLPLANVGTLVSIIWLEKFLIPFTVLQKLILCKCLFFPSSFCFGWANWCLTTIICFSLGIWREINLQDESPSGFYRETRMREYLTATPYICFSSVFIFLANFWITLS